MFVNLFMLVLSINYEIQTITSASLSATTEAVNPIAMSNSNISTDADKSSTVIPVDSEISELPPTLTLNDFDRQLKDIFVITGPTSTHSPLDEFSPEAANPIPISNSSTTEALNISKDAGKSSTVIPVNTEIPELPPTLNDFDRQLKDIFVITGPTSTPFPLDEFSPEELEISDENGETLSLGRRTNFKTRYNCRCIIRNRCARTDSCLKEAKKK